MIELLGALPANRVRTVTPDRGREFARYRELAERLNTKVFFPDPHAPQQRGTNENTNGLIREYFPKNTDLDLQRVLVQIFLADLILVYWVPRNEGLRA